MWLCRGSPVKYASGPCGTYFDVDSCREPYGTEIDTLHFGFSLEAETGCAIDRLYVIRLLPEWKGVIAWIDERQSDPFVVHTLCIR